MGSWMNMSMLMMETASVMTMRMMGMAGLWSVTKSENERMVSEKSSAFLDSAAAASVATMTGKRPDEVMNAALRPLRRKTRANARRLGKRGPALPGPKKR
ncbi:antifreeze protein [Sulfitobacter pseudonitzschiae]|nr:antifreeze protein [Pseudosulfitobacter pseudonitzschiae]MBM1830877.1 antifreeze protein [Pseudosulfitobacter pseudonitzschiae]MBM1835744.1 antifreeze protein [Pseudosulfitobacter pseudonitzschiae]MBM1840590.1 antifreeze protein [Pseudosulfitobacter pseudonitzschiae]MBM1845422.1 antifreeze protein [Pseudosulfitobacter pseudonitzschiae]